VLCIFLTCVPSPAVIKTLAEIQAEEARAAAAVEAAAEAGSVSTGGAWAKAVGKPGPAGPAWGGPSEQLDLDNRQRTSREVLGQLGEPVAPTGITLG
jgi:hypothetical protein